MHAPSFAKINWTLEILGRRSDGYHELRTILQTIEVHDDLHFMHAEKGIKLSCDNPAVPRDETNLIYRAAASLQALTGCDKGVKIALEKKIPMGAGLGGGSSNAAIALLALCKLWEIEVTTEDLFKVGSQLGSDVPFFFFGGTGIGIGRGDEVYPMSDMSAKNLLLINPKINVPTPEIYRNLPSELTSEASLNKMPLSLGAAYAYMQSGKLNLRNDLERSALKLYPLIGEIKEQLIELNAIQVLMSGSGSTVFAVFESDAARAQAQSTLSENDWWCDATRTLNRSDYQAALKAIYDFSS